MPGTILRAIHIIMHLILLTLYDRYYYYPHFTDDETEATEIK